jgi:hypothetical protein
MLVLLEYKRTPGRAVPGAAGTIMSVKDIISIPEIPLPKTTIV